MSYTNVLALLQKRTAKYNLIKIYNNTKTNKLIIK